MSGRDLYVREVSVAANYEVPTYMDYVYADAAGGAITITLKRTKDRMLRRQVVVKIDSSANAVTVTDGTLSVDLVTQDDAGVFEQKGTGQFFMSSANLSGAASQIAAGQSLTYSSEEYADDGSFQPIGPDLNLDPAAGTSDVGDSSYLATIMGNIFGTALTKTHNMIAAVIGKLSVGGTRATTYPLAAVIGEIGEDSEHADGAVVAVIGGDGVAVNANAAFGIDHLNSNAGAGFDWVVDGHKEAHDGYNAGVPLKGFARLNQNSVDLPVGIYFGAAVDDVGIVAQVGADATIGDGSLYISHLDGAGLLFQKQNDVWVDLQV